MSCARFFLKKEKLLYINAALSNTKLFQTAVKKSPSNNTFRSLHHQSWFYMCVMPRMCWARLSGCHPQHTGTKRCNRDQSKQRISQSICSAVHSATISCRHFNVSIGQVDEHAGKNSIFLPDELLNHLRDGWLSEKNPYPFYLLSFIGHCLSGHQKRDRQIGEEEKEGE